MTLEQFVLTCVFFVIFHSIGLYRGIGIGRKLERDARIKELKKP